jgi:hypothetical protein
MDLKCDFEHKYWIETLVLNSRAAIKMHPQQWKTAFSIGSLQRRYRYLKNKWRYSSVLSSDFLVEDSHGKFIDLRRLGV